MLIALMLLAAAGPGEDRPNLEVVHKIKDEAFRNGKVMEHMFWLTDANGPRLTCSPGYQRAADWALRNLNAWGASKAHLEKWGDFGRGWSQQRFALRLVEPAYGEIAAVPKAWSGGTNGPTVAEVVHVPLFQRWEREEAGDLDKLAARIQKYAADNKGKLKGKVVLLDPRRDFEQPKEQLSTRYDEKKLVELMQAPEPVVPMQFDFPIRRVPRDPKERAALFAYAPTALLESLWEERRHAYEPLWDFFRNEGVVAVFTNDDRGEGGLVFAESTGEWDPRRPLPQPVIAVAPEHYDRLVRLVGNKLQPKVELDLKVETNQADAVNVVAELPGTGKHKDEVVMLGAHLDSWHGGTGATDNAAGSAVMLEAFRVLKALNLPLDRTVRIALWSGEEQGLYGSRGYVKEHFGDPVTMKLKPEHAKLAAYFNVDNGSGKIRGVWLQGNDMVRPIFEQWLQPFRDEGAMTLSIRNTGGTDHLSFDAVGLPGFQFIQDPLDYSTRTHHSDLDVYDHTQPGDLMQASAIVASFVYNAANRAEMLPRKPLPKALPQTKQAVSAE